MVNATHEERKQLFAPTKIKTSSKDEFFAYHIFDAPFALYRWFMMLNEQYGHQLLVLLFTSQHLMKGLANSLAGAASSWIFKSYHVPGPTMQIYGGVASMPWALKPIVGMISDIFPIGGYNKAPYILITSLIGVASLCYVGFGDDGHMGIGEVVMCMFFIALQFSTCDLLTEAKYAEQLTAKPEYGPDLMTYVWSGITIGGIVATLSVGWVISTFGARMLYRIAIIPAALILWPVVRNYLQETPQSHVEITRSRKEKFEQKECFFLCVLMFAASIFLSCIGMFNKSALVHFVGALVTMIVVLVAFSVVLRPEIAKMNAFFLVQTSLGLSIGGASFYFYTNGPAQYKDGPHFSVQFFTTVLGMVGSVCSLIGLMLYNRYMKDWTYRRLLLIANVAAAVLSLGDLLFFTRRNLQIGIPDHYFVLGSSISETIIGRWQWMPGVVMLSQMCPKGMEATMYALLAGCHNLGNTLAGYLGAYILECLNVRPTGSDGEDANFDNLWIAALISTILPTLTLTLVPFLIPDARQTDKLLADDDKSATSGSLWQKWVGKPGSQETSVEQLEKA